ncbi:MAG: NUDIX domain-containing protein [Alphaproteobacteria bacterium]|nr:NUDIX domain-containing protein [Alphaproteobacteria bacterium]
MRRRDSARLLILNGDGHLLLFRFVPDHSRNFWATPGGGVDEGETFEQAAIRELFEETGIKVAAVDPPVFQRELVFPLPTSGEPVVSEERFFLIEVPDTTLSRAGWTDLEVKLMTEHRWWSRDALLRTTVTVYPDNLVEILAGTRFR